MKGIQLEGLRVLGRPERFARYYYETGADELLFMDVVASLYGRNSLLEMIARTSREIFIPLTVGGGLRSIDDIRRALRAGADKVSLNTAAIAHPELVREAARSFGSSTIVISIEAIDHGDGRYEAYTENGRQATGKDAIEWAEQAADLGAGELLVTSIDREGTGSGFDLELIHRIGERCRIPLIACGGAGSPHHVAEAIAAGADAVCIASVVHYEAIQHWDVDADSEEGNIEYLQRRPGPMKIRPATIADIKVHLRTQGITARSPGGVTGIADG